MWPYTLISAHISLRLLLHVYTFTLGQSTIYEDIVYPHDGTTVIIGQCETVDTSVNTDGNAMHSK